MTCAYWMTFLQITNLSCSFINHFFSHLTIISVAFYPCSSWESISTPHYNYCLNPPTALLVLPTLSFFQFPATPLGSCQKSFSSQSPTGASQLQPGKKTPCDGVEPMSNAHNCTLPGGKVHSESMNVSIFNLPGRKRGAKQSLLKQCLNITQCE